MRNLICLYLIRLLESVRLGINNYLLLNKKKLLKTIWLYGEIVDFGKSDEIIKIIGKSDKSKTYNVFSGNISFFINEHMLEENINTKPFVSVWFIHISSI